MDNHIVSEEEYRIHKEIEEKQMVLDKGWSRPKKKRWFIGAGAVSEEEYLEYQRKQREIMENHRADEYYTSTGEEWETNSDGDYTPDWLYDKI